MRIVYTQATQAENPELELEIKSMCWHRSRITSLRNITRMRKHARSRRRTNSIRKRKKSKLLVTIGGSKCLMGPTKKVFGKFFLVLREKCPQSRSSRSNLIEAERK